MTERRSTLRMRLLAGAAISLAPAPALAQAYPDRALQGDLTTVLGTVGIARTPALDTVTISSPQAIINWNPETGGPLPAGTIDFLPAGSQALFRGGVVGQDFVVLNRILPSTTRSVAINGTVTSQISPIVGLNVQGGSVWFYSPGGIIAGPTAVFNVGNLVLTADDIDTTGGLFGASGTIRFRGAAGSTSAVTIQPGAQLNLSAANSYLALVAPQVAMGGTATVNGSTAYVAAEQVDVRINGGLFDIAFLTGTDVANALIHTGTTTGPATANGTIAMAVMPKNTAITLLVGGTVGYTPAATATVQNGAIVLAAGYDVTAGVADTAAPSTPRGNITLGNTAFTSSVAATASNILDAGPTAPGTLSFSSNASLTGGALATLGADSGEVVTIGGNLTLSTSANAGSARVYATATNASPLPAPTVTVAGTTAIAANATAPLSTNGQAVTAGIAQITATGGSLAFTGGFALTADAVGGDGTVDGGDGTGGIARVDIGAGATLTAGASTLSASGTGGRGLGGNGGLGRAGSARLTIGTGGTASFAGALTMMADATGGIGNVSGGDADAGQLGGDQVSIAAGATLTVADFILDSRAFGAANALNQHFGANAVGGAITFANSGSFTGNNVSLIATATGSNGAAGRDGGNATGNSLGAAATLTSDGSFTALSLQLDATATGGNSGKSGGTGGTASAGGTVLTTSGGTFDIGVPGQPGDLTMLSVAGGGAGFVGGGLAQGKGATATFSNGTVATIGGVTLDSSASGGNGFGNGASNGGTGTAGSANLTNGGSVLTLGSVTIGASGTGGAASGTGAGGLGVGGSATATGSAGTTTSQFLATTAAGRGGDGPTGGNGNGGASSGLTLGPGATWTAIDGMILTALGQGGTGTIVRGGSGTGGNALLDASSGQIAGGSVTIDASGRGGDGGGIIDIDGAPAGSGTGGTASFTSLFGSTIDVNGLSVRAAGTGGVGLDAQVSSGPITLAGGNGGDATGGTATIDWQASSTTPADVTADASAFGGKGSDADANNPAATGKSGGRGGDATGGTANITLTGPSTNFNSVSALTQAVGGNGGRGEVTLRGGDAVGGNAAVTIDDATLVTASLSLNAAATGGIAVAGPRGAGPRGADATGGTAAFTVSGPNGGFGGAGGVLLDVSAGATSGFAGESGDIAYAGGRGGNARGGAASLIASNGTLDMTNFEPLIIRLDAVGGDGGAGGSLTSYNPAGGAAGGDAGAGAGGSLLIDAAGGTILGGALTLSAIGTAGTYGFGGLDAGLPASGTNPAVPPTYGIFGAANYGVGGSITLRSQTNAATGLDGRLTLGDVVTHVNGETSGLAFGYAGNTIVENLNGDGTPLTLASMSVDAGPLGGAYSGVTRLTATNAPIVITDSLLVVGSGDTILETGGIGTITASDTINIANSGMILGIGNGNSGDSIIGGTVSLSADRGIDTRTATVHATGDLDVFSAGGNVLGGNFVAGGHANFLVDTATGTIALGDVTAGSNLTARGASVAFGTIVAGANALIAASEGSVTGTSATGATVELDGGGSGGITVPTVISANQALLSAGGAIRVDTNLQAGTVTAAGASVFLRSIGAIDADNLTATAGDIDVSAASNLTVNNASASGAILLGAQDLASIAGSVIGGTIALRSADVAIAPTATVGELGSTTSVSFTNTSSGQTFFGGADTGTAGYHLGDTELQRVFANDISLFSSPLLLAAGGQGPLSLTPGTAPDLILDTLTLTGGTNLGTNGTLRIQTPGKLRVVGTVTLNAAIDTNTIDLRAGASIEALPTSSIVMTGRAGLAGTLALTSEDIIASSPAALADVAKAADLRIASNRLGQNDGTAVDGGYFEAGGIVASVTRGIYVQNSGTSQVPGNADYPARRGFTVGNGGFTVVQASSAPIRIAINGVQQSKSGTNGLITGKDLIPATGFRRFDDRTRYTLDTLPNATSVFDPKSTINGCVILAAATGCTADDGNQDFVRDPIRNDFGKDGNGANLLPVVIITLKDFVPPVDEPLIDEPVTGAGNDDLWSVDDGKCDPAKATCPPGG